MPHNRNRMLNILAWRRLCTFAFSWVTVSSVTHVFALFGLPVLPGTPDRFQGLTASAYGRPTVTQLDFTTSVADVQSLGADSFVGMRIGDTTFACGLVASEQFQRIEWDNITKRKLNRKKTSAFPEFHQNGSLGTAEGSRTEILYSSERFSDTIFTTDGIKETSHNGSEVNSSEEQIIGASGDSQSSGRSTGSLEHPGGEHRGAHNPKVQLDKKYSNRTAVELDKKYNNRTYNNRTAGDPKVIEDAPSGVWQLEEDDAAAIANNLIHQMEKRHIIEAKMGWYREHCYLWKTERDSPWTYEICLGSSIGKYQLSKQESVLNNLYVEIGYHVPAQDQLFANGTVIQWYEGGKYGYSAQVRHTCGHDMPIITGLRPLLNSHYEINFVSPSFCDWREQKSKSGEILYGELVHALEGRCFNYTSNPSSGHWSYEYCHPDSLTQFSRTSDLPEKLDTQIFLLGTNTKYSHFFPVDRSHPIPLADFPRLRSPIIKPTGLSEPLRFPRPYMMILEMPEANYLGYGKTFHKALVYELGFGTTCKETGMPRAARILFVCPTHTEAGKSTKILRVVERNLCQYDVYIQTLIVCAHPELNPMPSYPPQSVWCVVQQRHNSVPISDPLSNKGAVLGRHLLRRNREVQLRRMQAAKETLAKCIEKFGYERCRRSNIHENYTVDSAVVPTPPNNKTGIR